MDGQKAEPHKSSSAIWVVLVLLLVVGGLAFWGYKRRQASAAQIGMRMGQQPIVPVIAGTVEEKDVPVYLDGLGTVQAYNTVTVHVRVDGQLKKVAFAEGQDVHAGDLLAVIDPDPYQTALDQAIAKKGEDEAQLVNAQIGLKRETDLLAAKIDAQQVYDTQKALADQMDATVKADQAAIATARVNLNYCTITAPISGRIGMRLVDQGNMVHATDTNGLVVITQLQPISVIFTLPEQELDSINKEILQNGSQPKVLAVGRDNNDILDEGTLAVIDNQIDTTTGTIRLKANFPNPHNRLWPGQFVNARLLLTTRKNGLVVPTAAIQRGPNGAYVFVILPGKPPGAGAGKSGHGGSQGQHSEGGNNASAASDKSDNSAPAWKQNAGGSGGAGAAGGGTNQPPMYVKIQPVTVAPEVTGADALITAGLKKGDRIVVDGQYKLQDGSPVRISSSGAAAAKSGNADSSSKDAPQ